MVLCMETNFSITLWNKFIILISLLKEITEYTPGYFIYTNDGLNISSRVLLLW